MMSSREQWNTGTQANLPLLSIQKFALVHPGKPQTNSDVLSHSAIRLWYLLFDLSFLFYSALRTNNKLTSVQSLIT